MTNHIRLEVAVEADAEQIRDLMIAVERDETEKWFDHGERPFIPGYALIDMQKYHMWDEKYYKIMSEENLAGVLLISYTGREHARIDRLYIDPSFQNKGIGAKALELIEQMYPMVKIWTLDTIQKSTRNHYFYEKYGYEKIGEDENERYYRKTIGNLNIEAPGYHLGKDYNHHNYRHCDMEYIDVYDVNMGNSRFTNMNIENSIYQNSNLSRSRFTNINMSKSVIGDANLNKIEICHVSLADAYIHDTNLGFQQTKIPLTIKRCELMESKIIDSNLQGVSINNCNLEGMTIDGILVTDLLKAYGRTNK